LTKKKKKKVNIFPTTEVEKVANAGQEMRKTQILPGNFNEKW
jgi:hypothetical protein